MNYENELLFLFELRLLCDAVDWRVEHIEAAQERWLQSIAERVSPPPRPKYGGDPEGWARQNAAQGQAAQDRLNRQVVAQTEAYLEVEAASAAIARISLILFPTGPADSLKCARGRHLRTVLNVPDDDLLAKRDVRNKLMHYDEVIDGLEGHDASPFRFARKHDVSDQLRGNAMRLLEMDSLLLYVKGVGELDLRRYRQRASTLRQDVERAIDSWGDRHKAEFLDHDIW